MISKVGKAVFTVFVMAGVSIIGAQAQENAPAASEMIRLRGISAEAISSPNYSYTLRGMSTSNDGRANWLRVMAEYDTAPDWIDEITFTFYVVLQGDEDDLPAGVTSRNNLFSGSVTYVHVPTARRMVADLFLDPNTFARFGRPTYSAVVVTINGENAAGMAEPASSAASQWWTRETPNEIPLLTRKETPFALVEHDRLPTIKP